MILTFRETLHLQGAGGAFAIERRCIEHPRLTHLEQRLPVSRGSHELVSSNSFRVDGIGAFFGTIIEALEVLRAIPRPGDIVSIPPLETSEEANEEVHRDRAS